jgi:hypothetical protein
MNWRLYFKVAQGFSLGFLHCQNTRLLPDLVALSMCTEQIRLMILGEVSRALCEKCSQRTSN